MSSTINASTASGGGVITSADASGILQLQTAGVTGITIDASQNVGIGTSSPATWGKFAVVGASSGGQVVASIANTSGTANTQAVLSFDTTNNGFNVRDSQIRATNSGGNATTLEFYTANAATPAERMRIDSSGQQSSTIVGYGTYNEYKCRAWVNFNGTGTVAIRASGNVSSITDTGVGGYTVNFTTAMPDANYAVTGLCSDISVNGAMVNTTTLSTSGVTIATRVPAAYLGSDQALITIAINR